MSDFKLFGVVHLPPLPGTPYNTLKFGGILNWALEDAQVLIDAQFDGLIVENYGDSPFFPDNVEPHTVAQMSIVAHEIKNLAPPNFTLGINVLRNDAIAALAIAQTVSADFVRVNVHSGSAWTDQGLIHGRARQSLNYRKTFGASGPAIAADILVKHAHPAGVIDPIQLARDTASRGGADALIFTGNGTGLETDINLLSEVRLALPQTNIWVGSGITPGNIIQFMEIADAGIIGTYLHEDGDITRPLCSNRCSEIQSVRCEKAG